MNVLMVAWICAGRPAVKVRSVGSCARCGDITGLGPVRDAISKTFTAFDGWCNPNGRGLCPPCSWGYATVGLRQAPRLVSRRPIGFEVLTRPATLAILTGGAIGKDVALTVPLRPGRKHLMPEATWGGVRVDDGHLTWREQDARMLRVVVELRSLGFGSRMLTQPAPPFSALTRLPPQTWQSVINMWEELAVWRTADNPWLPLAVHVSTPVPDQGGQQ